MTDYPLGPGILSFATPKLAVVALLVRVLNPSKRHRIFLWTATVLCWASLNVCVPLLLTSCDPAVSLWDLSVPKIKCRDPWILIHYSMYAGCELSPCRTIPLSDTDLDSIFGCSRLILGYLPRDCSVLLADENAEEASLECCIGNRFNVRVHPVFILFQRD